MEAWERGLALIPEEPPSLERPRLMEIRARDYMLRSCYAPAEALAEALAEAAAETARALGEHIVEARALNTLGVSTGAGGDPEAGIALLERARSLAIEEGSVAEGTRVLTNLSDLLDLSGRTAAALRLVEEGLASLAERAQERSSYETFLMVQGAYQLLRLGRLDEAEARIPERVAGYDAGVTALYVAVVRAELALLRGDPDGAEPHLAELSRHPVATNEPQWAVPIQTAYARLAMSQGRLADARGAVRRGLDVVAVTDELARALPLVAIGLQVEADAAARRRLPGEPGHDEAAVSALEQRLGELERRPGLFPEGQAHALLAHAEAGRLRTALGDAPPDARGRRRAAEAFDALSLPFPAAYARLREAEAQVEAGDRPPA